MDAPRTTEGATAVVVGGTRRIGRWVSETLLESGYSVHAIYRQDRPAAKQFLSWAEARGLPLAIHQADAADAPTLNAVLADIAAQAPSIDALVCCAGPSAQGAITATTAAQLQLLWDGNVLTVHNALQACLPRMPRGGRIVCFTIPGLEGRAYKHLPAYAVCKAALLTYCRSLARELAPRAVTVNCIALGVTDQPAEGAPDMLEAARAQGYLIRQRDLAAALRALVAADAGAITGTVINLSGGFGL